MDREQLWSRFLALSKGVKKGTKKKDNPEYERVGRGYRKRPDASVHHQPPGGGSGFSPRHNLGAVTHHEGGAFDHVRDEVHDATHKILTRAVRGARDHGHLQEMHGALGDRAMAETLDNFHEGHLRQILRNVDPHHPAEGDHHELRARVRDLASGKATPAEPSAGGRRRRKKETEAEGPAEFSRSMGARAVDPGHVDEGVGHFESLRDNLREVPYEDIRTRLNALDSLPDTAVHAVVERLGYSRGRSKAASIEKLHGVLRGLKGSLERTDKIR